MVTLTLEFLYSLVKDVANYFQAKNVEKVPLGKFMANLEKRLDVEFSTDSKRQLMAKMRSEGTLVTSRQGHMYVLIGKILP